MAIDETAIQLEALSDRFNELDVSYRYGWPVNLEEIKYSFSYVVSNMSYEDCTLRQLSQVIPLIFDVGYKGQFEVMTDDFYEADRRKLERSLLDKLLVEFTEDGHKIVIDMLAIIDKWYKE